MGCLWFENTPMPPGMRISCCSLIPAASSPSRCALGPPPGPGASLHHSSATPRGHCQIYLQSNWRVTVHLHPVVPNVTGDSLCTQRDWSVSPFLGLILTGTQISPKRNILSTHKDTCMLLVRELDNQVSRWYHCAAWDCTHSHSLNLLPLTMAVMCLQRKNPHNTMNFLCRVIPAYLSRHGRTAVKKARKCLIGD